MYSPADIGINLAVHDSEVHSFVVGPSCCPYTIACSNSLSASQNHLLVHVPYHDQH